MASNKIQQCLQIAALPFLAFAGFPIVKYGSSIVGVAAPIINRFGNQAVQNLFNQASNVRVFTITPLYGLLFSTSQLITNIAFIRLIPKKMHKNHPKLCNLSRFILSGMALLHNSPHSIEEKNTR